MAILKIARMGHPVLKAVAEPIEDPTEPKWAQLVNDMRDTLIDIHANGLAAPQVYVSKRLVLYRVAEHQIPAGSKMKPIPWTVLINPVIEALSEEQQPIWERCLSVPGLHGQVPRYTRIRCDATGLDGKRLSIKARGFHASLLQHECDHLDGYLYPMRMVDMATLSFNTELGDRGFFMPRSPAEFN
jgi:peptide deformylase